MEGSFVEDGLVHNNAFVNQLTQKADPLPYCYFQIQYNYSQQILVEKAMSIKAQL
jgi:hypothetical protein